MSERASVSPPTNRTVIGRHPGFALDMLDFGLLIGLVFLGALLDASGQTARAAMVPGVARLGGFTLERAYDYATAGDDEPVPLRDRPMIQALEV